MPPIETDDRPDVQVGASGLVELIWALSALTFGRSAGRADAFAGGDAAERLPELAAEARAFWGDSTSTDCSDGLELVPLGAAAGVLLGTETGAPLVARLMAQAAHPPADLALRSETAGDREIAAARLARLAADPGLRERYGDLLVRAWDAVAASAWEAEGRARVERAVGSLRERVATARPVAEALPTTHVMRRPKHAAVVEAALAAGARVLLAPTYVGGAYNSYYDVPGALLVTIGIERGRAIGVQRAQAEALASRLKGVADATRILLLAQLALAPASVSELADALDLAQPTVSVHLQKLRDAGLVQARREGGRTVHATTAADVDRVLDEVRRDLHGLLADGAPDGL